MLDDRLDDMRSEIAQLADAPLPGHVSPWSCGLRHTLQVYAGPAWQLAWLLFGWTVPRLPEPASLETICAQCDRLLLIKAQLDDMAERTGTDPARRAVVAACRTRVEAMLDARVDLARRMYDRWACSMRWSFRVGAAAVVLPQLVALGLELSNRPNIGLSMTVGSTVTILLAARLDSILRRPRVCVR